jgi:glycosyltransferase involved in cell wall biosynthesis
MRILLLPVKEPPFMRVRLSELFMREFASRGNEIHWVVGGSRADLPDDIPDGNHFHFVRKTGSGVSRRITAPMIYGRKLSAAESVIRENDIDLILANDGILEGMVGSRLKERFGIPFAYYLSSLFWDMDRREFENHGTPKNLAKYLVSYLDEPLFLRVIRRSDLFHPVSESMGDLLRDRVGNVPSKPLPLCPARSFIDYDRKGKIKRTGPLVLTYIGQVTPVRRMEFLIEIANEVRSRLESGVSLRIVGRVFSPGYRRKLNDTIRDRSLREVVEITGEVPFDEVPRIMAGTDIGLSILPPIEAYRVSSPTKAVEYMSLGIPVIGNREIGDQYRVIKESGGGRSPPYDRDEIVNDILTLAGNPDLMREMGEKGRRYIMNKRNYRIMAGELEEFYLGRIGEVEQE